MTGFTPINLIRWVQENRHLLQPPVGNKAMWDGDYLVMIVGGPNQRNDYHINPGPELFYQVEGGHRSEDHRRRQTARRTHQTGGPVPPARRGAAFAATAGGHRWPGR